jgi:hypothetical protein
MTALLLLLIVSCARAELFSGPQPGELLPAFKALAATGPHAGVTSTGTFTARFGRAIATPQGAMD